MAVFSFPNHRVSTEYPDSSLRMQMGNSYQFSAPPPAPDQRKFILKFAVMKWFVTPSGGLDLNTHPDINLALLDQFYNQVKLWGTFTYSHPVYGDLSCRFNKPLVIPEGVEQGNGTVMNIQVELIEVPGVAPSDIQPLPDSSLDAGVPEIQYVDFP